MSGAVTKNTLGGITDKRQKFWSVRQFRLLVTT